MSEFLLIHFKPEENKPGQEPALQCWAMGGSQHPSITLGQVSMQELKPLARGKKVSLLIDSNYTTVETINIPSKNRSKQLLAIPFAMEDLLADDIDDTHFAIGKSDENQVPVIAINRELLTRTLSLFADYQIHVDAVFADSNPLPATEEQWTVLIDGDSAIIKTDSVHSQNCDRENLNLILSSLLNGPNDDEVTRPQSINYYYKEDDESAAELLEGIEVEIKPITYKNHCLEIFIQHMNTVPLLNLLQGEFSPKREGNLWLKPWKSVAAVAAIWLGLQLGYDALLTAELEEKNIALSKQIETEFKRAIPDARKMTNMQKRVERRLKDLKSGGSGSNNSGFLQILSKVSPALKNNERINIQAAVYRNNYVDFDLTAKSLQDIETVKKNLEKIPGITTVLSTTVEKDNVKGRLRLEAKG